MRNFLVALESLFCWQVAVILVPCALVTFGFLYSEHRTRKAWAEQVAGESVPESDPAKIAATRAELQDAALGYWEATNPELAAKVEQIWRSGAHKRRTVDSPANQPVVPYVGFFCPDCGTRLDSETRPCPFGPHGSAA